MAIGEGSERKPLLHKRTSEREGFPWDSLQPPSFNTCHHIQEDAHCFRRIREVRSRGEMHGAARRQHKEMGGDRTSVRERITINRRPEGLKAWKIRDVERT